jgi:hypothetical protein
MIYAKFIITVVMKPYLERISVDNDSCKLKTVFLELFLDEVENVAIDLKRFDY